ncbi:uncharacterized protein LOC143422468 [Xylocopa sonorina]|uniref:uncharacterized protein LOC143422468 n=1 Tax=Xylocopa sonorina TaxID=1818115 RepID=UPI00403A8A99
MTMSHSVTIRTQTMTTSSTAVVINTGYLKTWSGIFKVLELALGVVCVTIASIHMPSYGYIHTPHLFFLLMTTTFLIGTGILLMSCLASFSTSSIIAKTTYEILFHAAAFALYLAASLTFIIHVSDMKGYQQYNVLMAAAVCGLVNAVLYFLSTLIALRTYRGL